MSNLLRRVETLERTADAGNKGGVVIEIVGGPELTEHDKRILAGPNCTHIVIEEAVKSERIVTGCDNSFFGCPGYMVSFSNPPAFRSARSLMSAP